MKEIRWLHISDLHMNKCGIETQIMRDKLLELLESLDPFDYVFITGDLRYAPDNEFSNNTIPYIKKILSITKTPINRLFVVPGNHDINRCDQSRETAINKVFYGYGDETPYYDVDEGIIRPEDLESISCGKADFAILMRELYRDLPDRASLYENTIKPHFLVESEDFNIIHIDSTISYTKHHQKDLYLGTKLLYDVFSELNLQKPSIILTHYSFDFLHRDEQQKVVIQLFNKHIKLWLAGHEHDNLARTQRDWFYEFQTGNLNYESKTHSCIMVGSIDPQNTKGIVQAYHWVRDSGWELYNKISPYSIVTKFYSFDISLPTNDSLSYNTNNSSTYKQVDLKEQTNFNSIFNSFYDHQDRGLLFTDDHVIPLDKVTIHKGHCGNFEFYKVCSDSYTFEISITSNEVFYFSIGYYLSDLTNVHERMYHFEKIDKILNAKRIHFNTVNNNESIEFLFTNIKTEEVVSNIEKTRFWINQMKQIAQIEKHFNILFSLPEIATEQDYHVINILNCSIERKTCLSLPGIPTEIIDENINSFIFPETEYLVDNDLPHLFLFGYEFKPIKKIVFECKLVKKRKKVYGKQRMAEFLQV